MSYIPVLLESGNTDFRCEVLVPKSKVQEFDDYLGWINDEIVRYEEKSNRLQQLLRSIKPAVSPELAEAIENWEERREIEDAFDLGEDSIRLYQSLNRSRNLLEKLYSRMEFQGRRLLSVLKRPENVEETSSMHSLASAVQVDSELAEALEEFIEDLPEDLAEQERLFMTELKSPSNDTRLGRLLQLCRKKL